MKKILIYSFVCTTLLFTSCGLFELDNYDEPKETIRGVVVDKLTGDPVLTDQSGDGIRVRMTELSWGDNVTHNPDIFCMPDGSFQNTKMFAGHYHITVDGPFIPIVREVASTGMPIADESIQVDIKGVTEVKFEVHPFLNVEFVEEPVAANGRITAKVRVTRAVDFNTFKSLIEPTGDYEDRYQNVTDLRLCVGYSSTMGLSAQYEAWSNQLEYEGAEFDPLLGEVITVKSRGVIPSGHKVFIRAAARIRYQTAEVYRYNYSDTREVIMP